MQKERAREQRRRVKVLGRLWLSVGRAHTALCIHNSSDLQRILLRFVITFADCWRCHFYFPPYLAASSANDILNTVISSTHNSLVRMKRNKSSDRQDSNKEEYSQQCTQVQVVCCELGSVLLWLWAEQSSASIWQPGTHRWRGGGGGVLPRAQGPSLLDLDVLELFLKGCDSELTAPLSLYSPSLSRLQLFSAVCLARWKAISLSSADGLVRYLSVPRFTNLFFSFSFFFLSFLYNFSPTFKRILLWQNRPYFTPLSQTIVTVGALVSRH